MTQKLLTLPIRIGFGAARTTFGITTRLVGTVIDIARPGSRDSTPRPQSGRFDNAPQTSGPRATEASPAPARPRRAEAPQSNGGAPQAPPAPRTSRAVTEAPPPPPAVPEVTPPAQQPDTPLHPDGDAVKTIDDTDELVATFAESGAEDGAGAQLDIDPPWEGYDSMNATAVIERLNRADAAELALLELYEGSHKKRQTVLNAASRRLRALSPPGGA